MSDKRKRSLLDAPPTVEVAIKIGPGTLRMAGRADKMAAEVKRAMRFGPRAGRPPGTNAVEDAGGDAEVRRIVADLRRNHRRVKLDSIAAASGAFTRDNLRRWLRENGKKLADY